MAFKGPIEEEKIQLHVEKSYFWGFWKFKFYGEGIYRAVVEAFEKMRKGRK